MSLSSALLLAAIASARASVAIQIAKEKAQGEQPRWPAGAPGGKGGEWMAGPGARMGEDKVWVGADGKPLPDADQARIKALRVPPAWTSVRLNPDPDAGLQAIGRDEKGRRQPLYTDEHHRKQAAAKFGRLREFSKAMPTIVKNIERIMNDKLTAPRDRDTAAVLMLIAKTGFRVGGEDDTGADKQAFGASTLQSQHVSIVGDRIDFAFTGKKGVTITKSLTDAKLAAYIAQKKSPTNQQARLFDTNDARARAMLAAAGGNGFLVKDFRTWHGTAKALEAMAAMTPPATKAAHKKAVAAVAKAVAAHLGNTPTVAKASYIAPEVWTKWDQKWEEIT